MKKAKLVHKHKRALVKKKTFFQKIFYYIISILYSSFKSIFSFIFLFFKKEPKLSAFFCAFLFCCFLLVISVHKILIYSDNILPNSVDIEINNPKIHTLISSDLSRTLAFAKKNHEKRSHFLSRVNNILFTYDQIDQYWIRLGFDRKLQVVATLQVPLLILEAKGGDKYVVSSTSKIIAKNSNINEYPGLYALSAPEIKINWRSKGVLLKYNSSLIENNTKIYSSNYAAVNFPWLINQTKIIYSNFQDLKLNFFLTKVIWNSESGYQLKLTEQKNNAIPKSLSEGTTLTVLLGKEKLLVKIKGLQLILTDLSQKNLHPNEIDLDYTDKASFKISSANSSSPLAKIF